MPNLCENMVSLGEQMDGAFAEYSLMPVTALHKISPELDPELAVFAEPLSCVVNATQKIKTQPGENVAVLGAGPIGLLFIQMFKACGARKIIVAEVSKYRAKYALETGATRLINPLTEDLEGIVSKETTIGADVVVDAVGTLFREDLKLVRSGGKVLLFGQNFKARTEITQNDITKNEINILGNYIAKYTFPLAIRIIESNVLNLKKLITHRFSLGNIHKGIEVMKRREAIKVIITLSS